MDAVWLVGIIAGGVERKRGWPKYPANDRQHRHPSTSLCRRRKRGTQKEAFGRSRGGFTTKIHLRTNGQGLPIAAELTGGEVADCSAYREVMDAAGPEPKVLLADKGYDADFIRADMEARGGSAVIPMKRNRKIIVEVDQQIYRLRNQVERCFNKLKNARRLATRYDKTLQSYLGFVHIASVRLWLRHFVNIS